MMDAFLYGLLVSLFMVFVGKWILKLPKLSIAFITTFVMFLLTWIEVIVKQGREWQMIPEPEGMIAELLEKVLIGWTLVGMMTILLVIMKKKKILYQPSSKKDSYERKKRKIQWVFCSMVLAQSFEIMVYLPIQTYRGFGLQMVAMSFYFALFVHTILLYERAEKRNRSLYRLKKCAREYRRKNDELRAFRHDFNNIMQALGGYLTFHNFTGLETYYHDVMKDFQYTSFEMSHQLDLSHLIAKQYQAAKEKGILLESVSAFQLESVKMDTFGMDWILKRTVERAIQMVEKAEKKEIVINILYQEEKKELLLTIANSYEHSAALQREEEDQKTRQMQEELQKKLVNGEKIQIAMDWDAQLVLQTVLVDLREQDFRNVKKLKQIPVRKEKIPVVSGEKQLT